jgi:fibronectin-binding autotransporter adhesin
MNYFTSPLSRIAVLLPLTLGSANAETKTLSGASTAWATAVVDSWTPAGLPLISDNVVISSTGTSDARGSAILQTGAAVGTATIQDLAMNSTAAINLVNNSTSTNTTLTLSGGRGAGFPLISSTGDFAYAISSPNAAATPRTLTLALGTSGDIDVGANTGTNTLNISAIISGAQSLNKTGAGKLVLRGTNTFSGGLTHSAGILRAETNAAALGAGTLTLTGAELQLASAAAVTFGRNTTITANTTIVSDKLATGAGVTHTLGTLSIGAQTLTVTNGPFSTTGSARVVFGATTITGAAVLSPSTALAAITLGATNLGGNLLTIAGAGPTTIGAVTSPSTADIARTGAGAATIASITSDTVNLNVAAAGATTITAITADTVNLNVTAAGTTAIAGVTNAAGPLNIAVTGAGAGVATISGISSPGTVTLTSTGTSIPVISGLVAAGPGGFVREGTGRAIMTGVAAFTTGVTLNSAITEVTSNAGLGTGPTVINTGATLEINLAAAVLTPSSITVNPGGQVAVRGLTATAPIILAGGNLATRTNATGTFAGPVNVTADSTATLISYTSPAANQSITISGLLSGSNALGVVGGATANNGVAALILTNPANTFSGNFNVAPLQRLSSVPATTGNTLGTATINLAATSFLRLNDNGTGSDGTLAYGNNINTAGAATIDLDRATGTNTGNTLALGTLTAAAGTITVNAANAYKASFSSATLNGNTTITNSGGVSVLGAVSGPFDLTKAGAGSLTLAGANTHGATTITAGTLNLTGSLTGGVALDPASTLTGSGSVGGTTTVANTATINPGTGSTGGILTTSALTFGAAAADISTVNFSVGANASSINVTGLDGLTVNSDGTVPNVVTLNLLNVLPTIGVHTVIDYNGAIQGAAGFSAFKLGPLLNPRINASLVNDTVGSRIALDVTSVDTPRWSGEATTEWSTNTIAGAKNWQLVLTPGPTDYLEGDRVVFNDDAVSGVVELNIADVTPTTLNFDNTTAEPYTLSGSKAITGATGLVKTLNGSLTISNINSFTGPVSISTGTVSVNSLADSGANSALGAGTAISLATGATLEFTGATGSSNRPVTVQTGGATVKSTTGAALALTGAVTLNDALALTTEGTTSISSVLAGTAGITVNGAGTTTLSGNVTNTGGLTKNGVGTTTLTGAANTAALTISAGVLEIGNATLPGSTGTALITNNATLSYNTPNTAPPALTTVTSANQITGTGSLTKTGPGNVVLSGATANDYLGTTTVSGGNLILSKANGINAIGGNLIVEAGGTVSYGTTAPQSQDHIPDTATITINGGTFGSGAGATLAAPTAGVTDTVAAVILNSGTFLSSRNATVTPFTLTGAFTAASGNIQVQRGGGLSADSFALASGVALDFDGGSTTAGQTSKLLVGPNGLNLGGNVLRMNNGPSLIEATSVGSVLALGGNVTTTGTNQITRTSGVALKAEVDLGAASRTFNVTGTLQFGTGAAPIIVVGTGGGLTKTGAGSMALSGANTYTGTTSVDVGMLTLDGSLASTLIDVKAGATFHTLTATGLALGATQTLSGSGTVQVDTVGITTVAGTKLIPGTDGTVGTLTIAPVTKLDLTGNLAPVAPAAAALKFDLATLAASDKIDLTTGSLDIGTGLLELDDISITGLVGFGPGTYTLIATSTAITGTLGAGVTGTAAGHSVTLALGDGGTDLILTVSGSLTNQQNWRNTYFATITNTGDAANTADPDKDGVANALEYLLGSDPTKGGELGDISVSEDGTDLILTYSRIKAALTDVTPVVETSTTLSPAWTPTGVTTVIFSDNGTIQVIKASVPISGDKRFLRLRVDSPN